MSRSGQLGRPTSAWPARKLRTRGVSMKQYLLSIYQPDGDLPAPGVLEKIAGEVLAVREEMRAAGRAPPARADSCHFPNRIATSGTTI